MGTSLNFGAQIHPLVVVIAALINDGTATHISNMAELEQHSSSSSGSEEFSLSNTSELDSKIFKN